MKECSGIDKTQLWGCSCSTSHMGLTFMRKEISPMGTVSPGRRRRASPWSWGQPAPTRHLCTSVPAVYPQRCTTTSSLHKKGRCQGGVTLTQGWVTLTTLHKGGHSVEPSPWTYNLACKAQDIFHAPCTIVSELGAISKLVWPDLCIKFMRLYPSQEESSSHIFTWKKLCSIIFFLPIFLSLSYSCPFHCHLPLCSMSLLLINVSLGVITQAKLLLQMNFILPMLIEKACGIWILFIQSKIRTTLIKNNLSPCSLSGH